MFDSVTVNTYAGDVSVNLLFITIFDNGVSVKRSEHNQQMCNICTLCKNMSMKFRFHFLIITLVGILYCIPHTFFSILLLLSEE